MSDTTSNRPTVDQSDQREDELSAIERVGVLLDEWRAKTDELLVKLDLADLDIRDQVRSQLASTQNAYLAARSRLSDTRSDAAANLGAIRLGLDQLLRDLRAAYDAGADALRRGSSEHQ